MEKNVLLLIEDNPLLTGLYKSAFEKEGVNVLVAHDGESGIKLAREKKPHVILLDLLMIGMDGFQVLEALKSHPETKDIKVVVLTIVTETKSVEKAKKLGAADYLIKSELRVNEIVKKILAHF